MRWNNDGSLLSAVSKDKKLRVFDPRNVGAAMVVNGHEGIKP